MVNNNSNLSGFKQKYKLMAIAFTSTAVISQTSFFKRLASLGKCKPSNTHRANAIDPANSCKFVQKARCQKDERKVKARFGTIGIGNNGCGIKFTTYILLCAH